MKLAAGNVERSVARTQSGATHAKKTSVKRPLKRLRFRDLADLLQPNEKIAHRWTIAGRIATGGFGQIFRGYDTILKVAVAAKVEPVGNFPQTLRVEVKVLRAIQGKRHAVRFYGYGRTPRYRYLIMQLVSRNLSQLRRDNPSQRFSNNTTFRLGLQAAEAIEELHATGFVHRDIKPSNFALGLTYQTMRTLFILDFGLATKYKDSKGKVRAARQHSGFRGTTRYASLTTHYMRELGRGDDLVSLFYMIVEMRKGQLPWRDCRDKNTVRDMKERIGMHQLCSGMPQQLHDFYYAASRLTFADAPDFNFFKTTIRSMIHSPHQPFEWEFDKTQKSGASSRFGRSR